MVNTTIQCFSVNSIAIDREIRAVARVCCNSAWGFIARVGTAGCAHAIGDVRGARECPSQRRVSDSHRRVPTDLSAARVRRGRASHGDQHGWHRRVRRCRWVRPVLGACRDRRDLLAHVKIWDDDADRHRPASDCVQQRSPGQCRDTDTPSSRTSDAHPPELAYAHVGHREGRCDGLCWSVVLQRDAGGPWPGS